MVIKGGSRSGAGGLAAHLLRTDTNERAEVLELHGVIADRLPEALREMEAVATGTRCKKPLYHASINTGPGEELTLEQKAAAVARLELALGLEGHARAVVEHRKEGRDHLHVVWSRIDSDTLRATHDGHNYRKHEEVARELEREFGHNRVQGAHVERDDQPRPPRTPSPGDMQQATRTKREIGDVGAELTRLWQTADTGPAFAAALDEAGYVLAQGDRRSFCVVDTAGGVHSLARRIEGANTKEVNARLAGIELTSLPSVDEARTIQRDGSGLAVADPPSREADRRSHEERQREIEALRARGDVSNSAMLAVHLEIDRKQAAERSELEKGALAGPTPLAQEEQQREDKERPAARLADELTRPLGERYERTMSQAVEDFRRDTARQQIRADLDQHLQDQAAQGRPTAAPMPPPPQEGRQGERAVTGGEIAPPLPETFQRPSYEPEKVKQSGAGRIGRAAGGLFGGLLGVWGRLFGSVDAAPSSAAPADKPKRQSLQPERPPAERPAAVRPATPAKVDTPRPPSLMDEIEREIRGQQGAAGPRPGAEKERDDGRSRFEARPIIRLGVVTGMDTGWIVEAKKRLIAYSTRTGASVLGQLQELEGILYRAVYGPA